MAVTQITLVDWAVFVGSVVLVWVLAKTGRKLDKREGIVLVSCYLAYLISLIMG